MEALGYPEIGERLHVVLSGSSSFAVLYVAMESRHFGLELGVLRSLSLYQV